MSLKRYLIQNKHNQAKKSKMSEAMNTPDNVKQEEGMNYVIMPWEDNTLIEFSEPDGQGETVTKQYTRSELIQIQLSKHILDFQMLLQVVLSYNAYTNKEGKQVQPLWTFSALKECFGLMEDSSVEAFFKEDGLLSFIVRSALELKQLTREIKLLRQGHRGTVKMQQKEAACILANAFLCTFPRRRTNTPSINFNTLFQGTDKKQRQNCVVEKIRCVLHYFRRVQTQRCSSGMLSFCRLVVPDHKFPRWDYSKFQISDVTVRIEGRIEDQDDHLQIDFANKYVGGGVLTHGCVQEEIRFMICPELIVSRLFTESLQDNEALLVVGVERFSSYSGYSDTFEFEGDYQDTTPFDESTNERKTRVVAIDALRFQSGTDQYRESRILREIKKAYVGFLSRHPQDTIPVATGNWGCGAYRGDAQLKSLLQIIAAAHFKRNVLYLTFGDERLRDELNDVIAELENNTVNVGLLYRILRTYNKERQHGQTVFQYVTQSVAQVKEIGLAYYFSSKNIPRSAEFPFLNAEECAIPTEARDRATTSRGGGRGERRGGGRGVDFDCSKFTRKVKSSAVSDPMGGQYHRFTQDEFDSLVSKSKKLIDKRISQSIDSSNSNEKKPRPSEAMNEEERLLIEKYKRCESKDIEESKRCEDMEILETHKCCGDSQPVKDCEDGVDKLKDCEDRLLENDVCEEKSKYFDASWIENEKEAKSGNLQESMSVESGTVSATKPMLNQPSATEEQKTLENCSPKLHSVSNQIETDSEQTLTETCETPCDEMTVRGTPGGKLAQMKITDCFVRK